MRQGTSGPCGITKSNTAARFIHTAISASAVSFKIVRSQFRWVIHAGSPYLRRHHPTFSLIHQAAVRSKIVI
jgi:hypothetical protein